MNRSAVRLFGVLFFLSGLAGLVYEVCWTRLLRLPMGNTVYSMTTVLTAFMAGLALGAWIAGRWIERRGHPLRAYAVLEAAIGLFCFVLPWIVAAETPYFRWAYRQFGDSVAILNLLKLVASGFVILVPATLMGATLPILCRYFIDDPARIGASVGRLYAVNALGAAAGALLAGFVLVPSLGLRGAMRVGVVISLAVAAIAWRAARRYPWRPALSPARPATDPSKPKPQTAALPLPSPWPVSLRTAVLAGYALSGLAAMVLQVAWARVLALLLGSSTYAFSLLVAAFILGLFVGSAVVSRVADRLRRPALAFAIMQLGIGFTALMMVPLFERVPEAMLTWVPQVGHDFARFQLLQFVLVALALLLPTACMGACLPLVARVLVTDKGRAAATVGAAYAWNAVGTIAGAFAGGFILLPHLGTQRTIVFGAAFNLVIGVLVLALALPRRRRIPIAAAAAAAAVVAVITTPPLDSSLISSGAYLYATTMRQGLGPGRSLRQYLRDEYAVLFEQEGLVTHTTVRDGLDGTRSLVINGKVDASDGTDMMTQVLSGHIATLLHPAPQDAVVIGLASGVTLAAVAQHPSIRHLDCIEIAPETVAASRLFDHVNHAILDDPRVQVILQDGRNHLALTDRQYDVIVSEPSNPWIAGIASLFTEEFFTACRARLRPDGVVCIWLQLYGSNIDVVRDVGRTFQKVFPDATLWESIFAADYLLVGSADALQVNWNDLVQRLRAPAVAADLAAIGIYTPADLLAHHVASGATLRAWIGSGEIYSDDRNRLEFDAPRLLHQALAPAQMQLIRDLARPHVPEWLQLPARGLPAADAAALASAFRARDTFWRGFVLAMRGKPAEALQGYRAALADNAHIAGTVPKYVQDTASTVHAAMLARGDSSGVEQSRRELLALQPAFTDMRLDQARLLAARGRAVEAEAEYRTVLSRRPRDLTARLELAALVDRAGRRADAETEVRQAIDARPNYPPALLSLGNYLVERGELAPAETHYRLAVAADPQFPIAWYLLANVLHLRGQHADAVEAGERALRLEPGVRSTRELLAECYRELGQADKAASILAP